MAWRCWRWLFLLFSAVFAPAPSSARDAVRRRDAGQPSECTPHSPHRRSHPPLYRHPRARTHPPPRDTPPPAGCPHPRPSPRFLASRVPPSHPPHPPPRITPLSLPPSPPLRPRYKQPQHGFARARLYAGPQRLTIRVAAEAHTHAHRGSERCGTR
ncbi:hypothetical protein B0H14DRAFT_490392 [Mycena olivaceomarginata]|nr:hypothetical protein B0H14DRAFT_490392 [Mycena olivaceomarginata]